MYLSYKTNKGESIHIFNSSILKEEADNCPVYSRRYTTGYTMNGTIKKHQRFEIRSLDGERVRYYFEYDGERIFVSDFEYLSIPELKKRLQDKDIVSEDLIIASIMKNAKDILFIEKRRVPDSVDSIFRIRSYCGSSNYERVLCMPVQENYHVEDWEFKIETRPVFRASNVVFGREIYYMSDYCDWIRKGRVEISSRQDALKEEIPSDIKRKVRRR